MCHGSSDLGQALFRDFMKKGKSCKKKTSSSSHNNLSKEQFIAGSQKVVQLIGDDQLLTYYVQVLELFVIVHKFYFHELLLDC